ncbi:asparagine synthase [Petroclostridium sp. X23]|jgi:ABC-type Mn2+/Zn2+ transport system permease subunit|uniref:asparagine synthase n=1 Tax=Petroclostridium sp. X23 TaxID=3045146 RepID=UPI0024ADC3EF|nr:asparagine synthase [Petroclostridium sp. X23]WHH60698.1 asparagine synthase [Petroclostridium sp. X23]
MREGLIPTVLGAAVTATGVALRVQDMNKKKGMRSDEIMPMVGAGLLGLGIAHIALGAIDLVQHRD